MGNRSPRHYPCRSAVSAAPITASPGPEQHPLFLECAGQSEHSLKISRHLRLARALGASILNQTTQEYHPRARKARYE